MDVKLGINTLLWTAGFTEADLPLLDRVKAWGFDGLEVATFRFDGFPARQLGEAARNAGLDLSLCSALTGNLSLIADDPQPALDFLRRGIDAAVEMDAEIFVGPFCAPVGHLAGRRRNKSEWRQAVDCWRRLAPYAEAAGIPVAIEPLNRFETYFLNLAADGAQFCEEVGSLDIGILFDTFHANIEEKSVDAGLQAVGPWLRHVHTCENDRGIPGSGHVDWMDLFSNLQEHGYSGWMVIESFGSNIPEIAAAACIWRDLAAEPDLIATEGLRFLRDMLA
jgi:D-psicose/D-tagatose/L-ribulose 3-epimerase